MSKKIRTGLFILLAVLFLLSAPVAVFYSFGWRIDWETKKIIQPGAFYFKIEPKASQIYLNGKSKEKTDFFFGSAMIDNLLPKKYEVEIKKEGYYDWKKTLEIKEREVTEAKNIVLVPKNPEFKIISKTIEKIYISPDNKKIIAKEKNEAEKESWALKLYELDKNVKSHLIKEEDFFAKIGISPESSTVELYDLKFSFESKKILLETAIKERVVYYVLELEKNPPLLTSLDFLELDVEKIEFNPTDSQKLFVYKAGSLSQVDLKSKETTLPVLNNVAEYSINKEALYYIDFSGFVYKTDYSFAGEKLNLNPFPLEEEVNRRIIVSSSGDIIIKQDKTIYLLDKEKKEFIKISDSVKNIKVSPDSKKLVYFNDYEIWILFLDKIYEQPLREKGEQLFLTRFSEKINDIFWLTSHYLIFSNNGKIKITEIDNRDNINIADFAEISSFDENYSGYEILWSQTDKKLYILIDKTLYGSEKLIP